MIKYILELSDEVIAGKAIVPDEAKRLLGVQNEELFFLFASAGRIRTFFRGNRVDLCAITNAKSGDCFEDCKFCSQSHHHNTNVEVYPLISVDEMQRRADLAAASGTHRFCFVTSGCKLSDAELASICKGVSLVKAKFPHLKLDGSLGKIDLTRAKKLKQAGLDRYNHNIETTPDFFEKICTTHKYADRIKTISILKEAGLEVCCGGIFGLGEPQDKRLEFGLILRDLDVDSVALNFLNPVAGTQLEQASGLEPLEMLKMVAIFRFIMPKKEIRICGGRQKNLRSLQPLLFISGADATIIGDYLTTSGSLPSEDLQMMKDLGLSI